MQNMYNSVCHAGGCFKDLANRYSNPEVFNTDINKYEFVPDERKYEASKQFVREYLTGTYKGHELAKKELVDALKYIVIYDASQRNPSVSINDLYEEVRKVDVKFGENLDPGVYGVTTFKINGDAQIKDYEETKEQPKVLSYVDKDVLRYIQRLYELKESQYVGASCSNVIADTPSDVDVEVYDIKISNKAERDEWTLVHVLTHELEHVLQKYQIPKTSRDCLETDAEYNTYRILKDIQSIN